MKPLVLALLLVAPVAAAPDSKEPAPAKNPDPPDDDVARADPRCACPCGASLPGDVVDVTGAASVALRIRVQAPPWQPLDRITIYDGTRSVRVIALSHADTAVVRYSADVMLPTPAASTFWVVRVDPAGPGDPVLSKPMPAFTNPVFAHVQ